jgi:hypothetical protein
MPESLGTRNEMPNAITSAQEREEATGHVIEIQRMRDRPGFSLRAAFQFETFEARGRGRRFTSRDPIAARLARLPA